MKLVRHNHANGFGKTGSLVQASTNIPPRLSAQIREGHDRARATGDVRIGRPVENAQDSLSPLPSVARLTGLSG